MEEFPLTWGRDVSVVHRCLTWKTDGSHSRRAPSIPPRCTDERLDKRIVRVTPTDRTATARAIRLGPSFPQPRNLPVCNSANNKQSYVYVPVFLSYVFLLTRGHRCRRLRGIEQISLLIQRWPCIYTLDIPPPDTWDSVWGTIIYR